MRLPLLVLFALPFSACHRPSAAGSQQPGHQSALIDSSSAGIRLRLTTGRIIEMGSDTAEGDGYRRHDYIGIDSALGYHVVARQLWEAHGYALIHPRSGRIAYMPERPVAAPDGAHAAVAVMDFDVGYMANEVQIWRIDQDSLALVWSETTGDYQAGTGWGAARPRWLDAERVQFDRYVPVGVDSTRRAGIATLIRDGPSWRFENF